MSSTWGTDHTGSTALNTAVDQLQDRVNSLKTMFSGPSAPAETVAYMLWLDTTNDLVKQRDAADAAWVIIGHLVHADSGTTDTTHWGLNRALFKNNSSGGAALTIDWSTGNCQRVVLDDNVTLTFSNPRMGELMTLILVQDAGGTNVVTFPAAALFAGGDPTISAGSAAIDVLQFVYEPEAAKYLCVGIQQNLT